MGLMRSALIGLFALTFLVGSPPAVQAGLASAKARAGRLFKDGNACFARGDYYCALEKFRQARSIFASHKIDLNIGSALAALERHAEAAASYHRFIKQASGRESDRMVREARRQLERMEAKVAVVQLRCATAGAGVMVAGTFVGHTPLPAPLWLDPGSHTVVVELEGRPRHESSHRLAAGQRLVLQARLSREAITAPTPNVRPQPRADDPHRTMTIAAITTLGAGAALAVTSGVLFGVGMSQGQSAHADYLAATSDADADRHADRLSSAETKLTVGWVVGGAALVSLGASLALYLLRPDAAERVDIAVTPGGIVGRF